MVHKYIFVGHILHFIVCFTYKHIFNIRLLKSSNEKKTLSRKRLRCFQEARISMRPITFVPFRKGRHIRYGTLCCTVAMFGRRKFYVERMHLPGSDQRRILFRRICDALIRYDAWAILHILG